MAATKWTQDGHQRFLPLLFKVFQKIQIFQCLVPTTMYGNMCLWEDYVGVDSPHHLPKQLAEKTVIKLHR